MILTELRKILFFLWRDVIAISTYKLAFSMQFMTIAFNLMYFILFGSMFGSSPDILNQYQGDYISYLLIGSIGWGIIWMIMHGTASSIRQEMLMGTLESILLTPTRIYTIVLGYATFGLFFGFLSFLLLFSIGYFAFGIAVFASATLWTLLIFLLSIIMMIGVGMIFCGLTIWQKNIGQTATLLQNITMFFSGVYFPVAVLPSVLAPVSKFIPFYYSIEGIRQSLIATSDAEILPYVIILMWLTIGMVIAGAVILHKGVIKAKIDGSLAHY